MAWTDLFFQERQSGSQGLNLCALLVLVVCLWLSAKTAILIVAFARELEGQGRTAAEAALEAARTRLRPILMTVLAFSLGMTPLARATGAGAGAQTAIGIGVSGGMLSATLPGVFMAPSFYVVIRRLTPKRSNP